MRALSGDFLSGFFKKYDTSLDDFQTVFKCPLLRWQEVCFLFCLNSNALILNLKGGFFKELGIDHIVLT